MKIFVNIVMVGFMALAGISFFMKEARAGAHVEKLVIVSQNGTKHTFEVEIAASEIDKEVGLMFRTQMDPDHGMLFEHDQTGVLRYWMKNTLIPLDMLFIASDGTIKTIHQSAVPKSLETVSSEVPVIAALELNGGRAAALGITAGDKVEYSFF
jgi:hypothetical protein